MLHFSQILAIFECFNIFRIFSWYKLSKIEFRKEICCYFKRYQQGQLTNLRTDYIGPIKRQKVFRTILFLIAIVSKQKKPLSLVTFGKLLPDDHHIIIHCWRRFQPNDGLDDDEGLSILSLDLFLNHVELSLQGIHKFIISMSLYLFDVHFCQLFFFKEVVFLRIVPIGHKFLELNFIVIRPKSFHGSSNLKK